MSLYSSAPQLPPLLLQACQLTDNAYAGGTTNLLVGGESSSHIVANMMDQTTIADLEIPYDVYDMIIDAAYNDTNHNTSTDTMRSCSLVCRNWRDCSQKRLFEVLMVSGISSLRSRLRSLSRMPPYFEPYVQRLIFLIPAYLTLSGTRYDSHSSGISEIPHTLRGRLNNLRSITLRVCQADGLGGAHDFDITTSFLSHIPIDSRSSRWFSDLAHITQLRLVGMTFPNFYDFVSILHMFKYLQLLSCRNVSWTNEGALAQLPNRIPFMKRGVFLTSLRSFEASGMDPLALYRLVNALGPSLDLLQASLIDFNLPSKRWIFNVTQDRPMTVPVIDLNHFCNLRNLVVHLDRTEDPDTVALEPFLSILRSWRPPMTHPRMLEIIPMNAFDTHRDHTMRLLQRLGPLVEDIQLDNVEVVCRPEDLNSLRSWWAERIREYFPQLAQTGHLQTEFIPAIVRLPIEVWERVIDASYHPDCHYSSLPALYSFSLVCRQWLPRSRRLMFSKVKLTDSAPVFGFREALELTPALGSHVEELHLTAQNHHMPRSSLALLPYYLGKRLPNLKTLVVKSLDNLHGHAILPAKQRARKTLPTLPLYSRFAVLLSSHFPKLVNLSLENLFLTSSMELLKIMRGLCDLRFLRCRHIRFQNTTEIPRLVRDFYARRDLPALESCTTSCMGMYGIASILMAPQLRYSLTHVEIDLPPDCSIYQDEGGKAAEVEAVIEKQRGDTSLVHEEFDNTDDEELCRKTPIGDVLLVSFQQFRYLSQVKFLLWSTLCDDRHAYEAMVHTLESLQTLQDGLQVTFRPVNTRSFKRAAFSDLMRLVGCIMEPLARDVRSKTPFQVVVDIPDISEQQRQWRSSLEDSFQALVSRNLFQVVFNDPLPDDTWMDDCVCEEAASDTEIEQGVSLTVCANMT